MIDRWASLGIALVLVWTSVPMAADRTVVIKEWDVPTPKSRPHDPAVAPDGSLWYTGQLANKLGRLDPKTGEIKEWTLKTPGSGPHGLVADREGNIWYTGNAKAHIGKLDPKTGEVTEYPMPVRAPGTRTPRCSTKRASSGSRSKEGTSSASSTPRPAWSH